MYNKIISFILIIIGLFSLHGCSEKKKERGELSDYSTPVVIDVINMKKASQALKLSQFAESISYIPLSDDSLLNDLTYSPVKIFDDTIYVDQANIYKYTPDGKFIKKLFKEGSGPGEAKKYPMNPAAFNQKERYATIYNYINSSYSDYSFDGAFLRKSKYLLGDSAYKQIVSYFNDFRIYRIEHFVSRNMPGNRLGPYLFYVENAHTDSLIYAYPNAEKEYDPGYRGLLSLGEVDMNFIQVDSVLWFRHLVIDTVYYTRDFVDIVPGYIFKTSEKYLNLREYTAFRNLTLDREVFESKSMIMSFLPLPKKGGLLFTTIKKELVLADNAGKVSGYSEKPVINDLDNYLKDINIYQYIQNRTFYIYNGYMLILIDAFKFFEEGNKSPFPELMEDSNPVLVKIKLKEAEI